VRDPLPIDAQAIYDEAAVVLSFGIASSTLARARRRGELRASRRGRRTYYLGQWLIDWLIGESGKKAMPPVRCR
jgi:hypothetical protein